MRVSARCPIRTSTLVFWATICKTVRPVLSAVSVTLVYCGQTVGRIQMKLGKHRPRYWPYCVRWRLRSPAAKRHCLLPKFSAYICCGQMARWIKMPLGRKIGLDPSDIVLDGDRAPPLQKSGRAHPNFRPCLLCPNGWMDHDATWHGAWTQATLC